MERMIRRVESHEAAAKADRDALVSMTPQQRLDRALDLIAWYRQARGETAQSFARVARGCSARTTFNLLVVGGHAVAFHGYPRFSEDLDCYVRPQDLADVDFIERLNAPE